MNNTAPTFGKGDGIVSVGPRYTEARGVLVMPDGKIVIAGRGPDNNVIVRRYQANGTPDTSFGTDGVVTITVGQSAEGIGLALASDGRIIISGGVYNGSSDALLISLDPSGALDATFGGGDGIVTTDAQGSETGRKVIVQSDGKIVMAGEVVLGGSYDFVVYRYDSIGTLDTTFGGDGIVTTAAGTGADKAYALVQQADGKILVAGSSSNGTNDYIALVRYNSDGTLDTSFGGDGIVTTAVGPGADIAFAVTIQANGKIIVAGSSNNGTNDDIVLLRYNEDGTLDTSFGGGDGIVVTSIGTGADAGNSVIVQSDGKIIVAGYATFGDADFAIVRYNADGSLDTSFGGGDGIVTTHTGASNNRILSAALQADGRIVVSGYDHSGPYNNLAVARYNADGTLDRTFETWSTLGGTVEYLVGGPAVVLDKNVELFDTELAAANNYGGSTLTLRRAGGANASDVFSTTGVLNFDNGALKINTTTIGSYTNAGGELVITFGAGMTDGIVNGVMHLLTYANASLAVSDTIEIEWVFSDGNTGAQGGGGALSAVGKTIVHGTNAPAEIGPTTGWRGEIQVNATLAGDQSAPVISRLANGGFVVVWQDASATGGDISGSAVRAQFYDTNSNPVGGEILVNSTTTDEQIDPAVCLLANGNVIVVWTDASHTGGDTSGYAVRGQLLDARGVKIGGELLITSDSPSGGQYAPDVTASADGGFIVSFNHADASGNENLRYRAYDASGNPLTNSLTIGHDYVNGGKEAQTAIATLADGHFVTTWTQKTPAAGDGDLWSVEAIITDKVGTTLQSAVIDVNATTPNYQFQPAVAALGGGGFVIVWIDGSGQGVDTDSWSIKAQVFDRNGVKLGSEFLVNSFTAHSQYNPAVTAMNDGGFMVAWDDWSEQDTENVNVSAQRFDATGAKIGPETHITTYKDGGQSSADAVTLVDGRVVFVWKDGNGSDSDAGFGIRLVVTDPRQGQQNGPARIIVSVPDTAADPLGAVAATLQGGTFASLSGARFTYTSGTTVLTVFGYGVTYDSQTNAVLSGTITNFQLVVNGVEVAVGENWMFDAAALYTAAKQANAGDPAALNALLANPSYRLEGTAGADRLTGLSKDDRLTGGAGNDMLDGAGSSDTAVFSGARADYGVVIAPDGTVTLRDLRNGNPDGTDTISHVESFAFSDGTRTLADLNRAPTTIAVSGTKILAGTAAGTVVGTLTGTDTDPGDSLEFSINDPSGLFEVTGGNKLTVKAGGISAGDYSVDLIGTDLSGEFITRTIVIKVSNGTPAAVFSALGPNGTELYVSDGTAAGTMLVMDINPGYASSYPGAFKAIADKVFFVATHAAYGSELWVTNGTAAGTFMLADIAPGPTSSSITTTSLTVFGEKLLFIAADATNGTELWVSDGTVAGTRILKDICPGLNSSSPTLSTAILNGKIFFSASDGSGYQNVGSGREPWVTDGTPEGTVLLKDIMKDAGLGIFDSSPANFTVLNGRVIFSATTAAGGNELYVSDGTAAGTVLLKEINSGSASSSPSGFTQIGNRLIFDATTAANGREIWATDGTPTGTMQLADINSGTASSNASQMFVLGSKLLFTATSASSGVELYVTDGTAAGTALLKDIYSGTTSSNPVNFVQIGSKLLFSATDATNGNELWVTDGTAAGTILLADINAGTTSSSPTQFIIFDNKLIFRATDSSGGAELWVSDGTAAGTLRLKDINSGTGSSTPSQFTLVGNQILFSADDGIGGQELWRTDGTAAGTYRVANIGTLTGASNPDKFWNFGTRAVFVATDGLTGTELYITDGTAAGTSLLKDIAPGSPSSGPQNFFAFDNRLLFAATGAIGGLELWGTDGTESGTVLLKDINPTGNSAPQSFTRIGERVIFLASDGASGTEIWATDGTAAGTLLLMDIYPGANASGARNLIQLNDKVLFFANNPANGAEIYVTDGTAAGTQLLKDINPGTASSSTVSLGFTRFGDKVVFQADDGVNGIELWISDGTAASTVMLKDIAPGIGGSNPRGFVVVDSKLYFSATDAASGVELWVSDGTAAGTMRTVDLNTSTNYSSPTARVAFNGLYYFAATQDDIGTALWATDGTAQGTTLIKDVTSGYSYESISGLTVFGDKLVFVSTDGTTGSELYISDGTAQGTMLLKDINSGAANASPGSFTVFGSNLYFTANDGVNGSELWMTDGTAAGTIMLKNISASGNSNVGYLQVLGARLVFIANDGTNGNELWTSDGTAAGTVMLKDINPGAPGSSPQKFDRLGDKLIFYATDPTNGQEVWVTDGTAAGTLMLKDINTGTSGSMRSEATYKLGDKLLFFANGPSGTGTEIFVTDGTPAGTMLLKDIYPGSSSSYGLYYGAAVLNGRLYFGADDGAHGLELWSTDGTQAGTTLVVDAIPGTGNIWPYNLFSVGGKLFFSGFDSANGGELWVSDGTAAGTMLLKDINPGTGSSSPQQFFALGNKALFVADDGVHGYELWITDGTAAGTMLLADAQPGSVAGSINTFTAAGDRVFFNATNNESGTELWVTDGTPAGTMQVRDINTSTGSSSPQDMTAVNGKIVFSAYTIETGREIWVFDPVSGSASLLNDIEPGSGNSSSAAFNRAGDKIFFSATSTSAGSELWVTDGTAAGTHIVRDIATGSAGAAIGYITVLGEKILFLASSLENAREIWVSDGTLAGTLMLRDIAPGTGNGVDAILGVQDGRVYFRASDPLYGPELWSTDGTITGTQLVKDVNAIDFGSNPNALTLFNLGNRAPISVSLSQATIAENAQQGSQVGTISGVDLDANDTLTYALIDSFGAFEIEDGNRLVVKNTTLLNYESTPFLDIQIVASDGSGESKTQQFRIGISNVNERPLAQNGSFSFSEDLAFDGAVTGSDPENDTLTYALFEQSPEALSFHADGTFHYIPTAADQLLDAGQSAELVVRYTASDGVLSSSPMTVTLTILGSDEIVQGTSGSDTALNGGEARDIISGLAGEDILKGFGGNDRLIGGAGNDVLDGGSGNDTANFSGLRADYVLALDSTDGTWHIAGVDGLDWLKSIERLEFSDQIVEMPTADPGSYLAGGSLNDTLNGTALSEIIAGNDGDDILDGKGGSDAISGGIGNDTIKFDGSDIFVDGGGGFDIAIYQGATIAQARAYDMAAHSIEKLQWAVNGNTYTLIPTAGGTHSETVTDTAGAESTFQQRTTLLNAAGQEELVNIQKDNGTRQIFDFDPMNAALWTQILEVYDANSGLDFRDTTYDDGSRVVRDEDQGNANNWSSITTTYASGAAVDYQDYQYDSGSRVIFDGDQGNSFNWTSITTTYAPSGQVDYQDYKYDNSSRWIFDNDVDNSAAWRTRSTVYADVGGAQSLNYQDTVYDDNSRVIYDWDQGDASAVWDIWETFYNTSGVAISQRITYDTGSVKTFNL